MTATEQLEVIENRDDVIIRGSTWAAIWHMSWPLLLNMASISVASFADIWVAGKLGSDVQAAIGIGGQIWFFMIMLTVALSAGTTALVSRYWGARDLETTIEAARQSLIFAVMFGVVSCAAGLAVSPWLLSILGATPTVQGLAWDYLKVDLLSHIPYTVLWVCNSIFRAKGNARIPMAIMGFITALVIVLDLVLCVNPFHVGISGIGYAWLISGSIGVSIALFLLRRSEIGACLDFSSIWKHGLSHSWLMRLMHIGVPACIQDLAWVGGNFVLFKIFAETANPTSAEAAWAVGLRVEEMIAGMPIYALSMAVATIVGQNLGAKQPDRAVRAGWQVAAIGSGLNTAVALIMFIFALQISRMMSADSAVITYTVQYLQVVGLSAPFVAIWLILFGAMSGAGYTKWPMWATVVCLAGIRLPLSWYLTVKLGMGPIGTWIGMAVSSVLIGTYAIALYRAGVWKHQKV
jgi:putative MATE family efflux protein